jgi:hypothetical protein
MTANATNAINFGITQQAAGYISAQVLNANGEVVRSIPEFKNLITDGGLDSLMGGASLADLSTYVKVGTGAGTPAPSDSTLSGGIARVASSARVGAFQTAAAPYYFEMTATYLFALGAVVATITCIGVGPNNDNTSVRAWSQLKDSSNMPTTLTILAGEQLSVTYKLRLYAPAFSSSSSVTIGGDASYTYTIYAAQFGAGKFGTTSTGVVQVMPGIIGALGYTSFTAPANIFGSAAFGAKVATNAVATLGSYTAGTFTRSFSSFWATTDNPANGVKGFEIGGASSAYPLYYVILSGQIPKNSGNTLSCTFTITIARYP